MEDFGDFQRQQKPNRGFNCFRITIINNNNNNNNIPLLLYCHATSRTF